ncbi:hypothetical protein BJ138DRAFT_1159878 [Hygrophoropsis aurantiaca]|uniref:Uncharacterized protein n=1 Tax=Hygrophoropsis aurantiaca TaxID=72124 RepID=A0ACB8A3B9_9AGAM|nr:hypothetical protein BJ138DRAFT_1159878 [Hygrophoropsis aurantiaca]
MTSLSLITSLPQEYAVLNHYSDTSFALGFVLCFALFGILVIQAFIYYTRFTKDTIWLRLFVSLVLLVECLNSALILYELFIGSQMRCLSCVASGKIRYLRPNSPLIVPANVPTWSFQAICILTGLVSTLVQAFFSWRIWIIGKSMLLPAVIMVISLTQCGLLMAGGVLSASDPNFGITNAEGAVIWLVLSAVCDIIIASRTAQLLFRNKAATNSRRTRTVVNKLLKLTIETGLVTVFATVLEFLLARFAGIAHHAIFYGLSKFYSNCLLATLNARLVIEYDSGDSGDLFEISTTLHNTDAREARSPVVVTLGRRRSHSVPIRRSITVQHLPAPDVEMALMNVNNSSTRKVVDSGSPYT